MARYRLSHYRNDVEDESASEEALAGLIQSLLLKRFESSWYAALQTINRMRAANEILVRLVSELEVVPPPEIIRELVGEAMEDDSFPQRGSDRQRHRRLRGWYLGGQVQGRLSAGPGKGPENPCLNCQPT